MGKMEKVASAIDRFNKFLITSHINLEGDSLGSQLAMACLLKYLGKDFVIYDSDAVPERYQFLPYIDLIRRKINLKKEKIEAALVLDCPTLDRTGKVKEAVKKIDFVINIDHHISNEKFGNVNWVDNRISSVGEMIYKLYKKMDCEITREIALLLYISILTDTGSFNYSNTSSATHEIVSELLGYGLKPYDITKSIYENKTVGEIKLLGKILFDIKLTAQGRIAYMVVMKRLYEQTGTQPISTENFVNFARSVKGVEVAALFREGIDRKNVFHISFRSAKNVDVNKIASFFGGGGHKNASGCTLEGKFTDVKRKVLDRIRDELS